MWLGVQVWKKKSKKKIIGLLKLPLYCGGIRGGNIKTLENKMAEYIQEFHIFCSS